MRLLRWAGEGVGNVVGVVAVVAAVIVVCVGGMFVFAFAAIHVHDWLWPETPYREQTVCWVSTDANGHPGLVEGKRRDEPFSGVVEVNCP